MLKGNFAMRFKPFAVHLTVICLLATSSFAEKQNEDLISLNSSIRLGATGQCPFLVTGGPQPTASLKIYAYGDTGCTQNNNQFWFLATTNGTPILLPSGTYSFSNNQMGQTTLCNQAPIANSFTISQVRTDGSIASVSTCFTFTCNSNQITCTQTGTLALVDAS